MSPNPEKFAIINVHIFDGQIMTPQPVTVIINGTTIESIDANTSIGDLSTIDADGGYIIPGLVDCHVHVKTPVHVQQLTDWGVTTALDMANWPVSLIKTLKEHAAKNNLCHLLNAGIPVTAPNAHHSTIPGMPAEALLSTPDQAASFIADRIADGSDYIKIYVEQPGPSPELVNEIVAEAHKHGKKVICHAVLHYAAVMAVDAKPDILTHVPMDKVLDETTLSKLKERNIVVVPTLCIVRNMTEALNTERLPLDYAHCRASTTALLKAGVPILTGSDCNAIVGNIAFGSSMHDELENLVEAGMAPAEALRAATVLPARYFGLEDRGLVEKGQLADLILLNDNPLENIKATRSIRKIWCRGAKVRRSTV